MSWTDPIDAYCERLGPGFWAEPVNALSNAAFLLAALAAFRLWRKRNRNAARPDRASLVLTGLVAVIGTGSFLFHTFADRWSVLADTIPIALFIYAYFGLALARFGALPPWRAAVATAGFLAASLLLAEPLFAPLVGSSAGYVPALLALFGIGLWLKRRSRAGGEALLAAGTVFLVSLALRTADLPLCDSWPLGTHFGWHILNALVLFLLLRAAIGHQPASERTS
ncbi:membrane protein [Aureimonas endophytica]|uniref:Membrane protein n=1 Tax=Aureimonas endophytica TaxID=2027858 RepID=A0A917A1X6_9HYPH|nr:ceramidase domain-containing protein [Aureimonas endophytica]GGE21511.1 membrane protein [Aureimonas endophytica]